MIGSEPLLNFRRILLYLSGVVCGVVVAYLATSLNDSKLGRITNATITVRLAHRYGEEFTKVGRELAGEQIWSGLSMEVSDDDDIKSLSSYFEGLNSRVPSTSPHGYGICCTIRFYDENGNIEEIATNYTYYLKQGRGDWEVREGCEEHILSLFNDKRRRNRISIIMPPVKTDQPQATEPSRKH